MNAQARRVETRLAEFEAHIWDHTGDPFQQAFDLRRSLTAAEVDFLKEVIDQVCHGTPESALARIRQAAREDDDLFHLILQTIGLTRSKIITDLRASSVAGSVSIPTRARLLAHRDEAWRLTGDYLMPRLEAVFEPLCSQHGVAGSVQSLNQATWPGWIRQERAKRQGHEAEHQLAILLNALGLPFAPPAKVDNPLSKDATVAGVSFDLVVPDETNPLMCVKATVHTAPIGQYGESKDHLEVAEAKAVLQTQGQDNPPSLLAFIDGVGLRSNRAGLEGMLAVADEFCQFRTLWKAAVLAASRLRMPMSIALPNEHHTAHAGFLERHESVVHLRGFGEAPDSAVTAGEAQVWLT